MAVDSTIAAAVVVLVGVVDVALLVIMVSVVISVFSSWVGVQLIIMERAPTLAPVGLVVVLAAMKVLAWATMRLVQVVVMAQAMSSTATT